jgi:hypothetical protein
MVMAAVAVQQLRPDEIEAYRLHQPAACIRGERDLCIRMQARLAARVVELEAREKRRAEDEAWANDRTVLVEFKPVTAGWEASALDGLVGISATAPTIHGALRALRAKVEGGAR